MKEAEIQSIFDGREATLEEILSAREQRAMLQMEMLSGYGKPLVSFTMNIAGPVKNSSMIKRAFEEGKRMLDDALASAGISVLDARIKDAVTGCELMYCVDKVSAQAIKDICVDIEDECDLGRLFDMDVIAPDKLPDERADGAVNSLNNGSFVWQTNGTKLERAAQRKCLICGKPGRDCAARRIHSVSELQDKTAEIINRHFRQHMPDSAAESRKRDCAEQFGNQKPDPLILKKGEEISERVTAALMEEVLTTPKPGLVDRNNKGSHKDMDIDTFRASAKALGWFWKECFVIGCETFGQSPQETFLRLRKEGLQAEEEMYKATGGVNTHKGAIFLMGTICGAMGRLWRREMLDVEKPSPQITDPKIDQIADQKIDQITGSEIIAKECSIMTREVMSAEYDKVAGAIMGFKGARGEIAKGLPGVTETALPLFRELLGKGMDRNDAGVLTFLALVARGEDTNMVRRGGIDAAKEAAEQAGVILEYSISRMIAGQNANDVSGENREGEVPAGSIEELDRQFIRQNLSPGGSADLLAITYFFHDYCTNTGRTL